MSACWGKRPCPVKVPVGLMTLRMHVQVAARALSVVHRMEAEAKAEAASGAAAEAAAAAAAVPSGQQEGGGRIDGWDVVIVSHGDTLTLLQAIAAAATAAGRLHDSPAALAADPALVKALRSHHSLGARRLASVSYRLYILYM